MTENIELLSVLHTLIRNELGLSDDRVVLYNQDWKLDPKQPGLMVEIALTATKPFGSTRSQHSEPVPSDPQRTQLVEVREYAEQQTVTVTLFSFNPEARQRRHEIVFALNSDGAQKACEKYGFKLSVIPQAVDVSATEGGAMLNKWAITIHALTVQRSSKVIEYFDTFSNGKPILVNP